MRSYFRFIRLTSFIAFGLALFFASAQTPETLKGKRILFLLGEREYGTAETLPRFARDRLEPLGAEVSFAFAKSNDRASPLCHEFEGLEALSEADVLVISARRRYPKTEDMQRIRDWIESGKPTLMIRTSSHAFGEREKGEGYQAPNGHSAWNTIDRDALGASYLGHYRDLPEESDDAVRYWPEARKLDHPILTGFALGELVEMDDKLYKYQNLDPAVEVLLSAHYPGEYETHPVAWIYEKGGKRVFYTSLGTVKEMAMPNTNRLLINALAWLAGSPRSTASLPGSSIRSKEASATGLAPDESRKTIQAGEGLAIDLVSREPEMAQPSFISFDERGRMWVVQYRQYPFPAGLTLESRDKFWRNRYTDTPAPPGDPSFVLGADRITIHEDTDGDGSFDHVKPFLEGLNLATSLAWDRDGIYVLQPPYLLYYQDNDGNDVPDGDPEVLLSGFGIEDTHSIANSMRWGPDGWLYGAQGSTVTAAIEVAGSDSPPIKSIGQLMWRYHPKKKVYEVFSEGGGNIWSCEFDSKGRLYAGANEGRKLGYHYMQGSYNRKNFSKHGSLSNPYAFGYFNGIEEQESQRVTTNLMIYEEGALPGRYEGAILTANALAGRVLASQPRQIGPSFHSSLIDLMLDAGDRWVRPVYLAPGPDGAVYVGDWYDKQVNHFRNHEGRISPGDGRIYRIRSANTAPGVSIDLGRLGSKELVDLLGDSRRWYRETARRLLGERQDRSVLPRLKRTLLEEDGQVALEALWALNLMDAFGDDLRKAALDHSNPWVRAWTVRLIGDEGGASESELAKMVSMARSDQSIETRQQLASTARRLDPDAARSIVAELMTRDEDADDPYMPLMIWWALEEACSAKPETILELFRDRSLFDCPMARKELLDRIMRRFAADGSRDALKICAELLAKATSGGSRSALVRGFEEAFRGRSMQGLPQDLIAELTRSGAGSLGMRIRQGDRKAIVEAKEDLGNPSLKRDMRIRIIEAVGEIAEPTLLDALLGELRGKDEAILMVTLSALQSYSNPSVGDSVVERYSTFSDKIQTAAQTMLASRVAWSQAWVDAIVAGEIDKETIPDHAVASLRRHEDVALDGKLNRLWPQSQGASEAEEAEMNRIQSVLSLDPTGGDRYAGRDIYLSRCAACHSLHSEGGDIGPELTGYQRHDLDSLLLAISRPNAEVREGFENYTVKTKDGQAVAGFLEDQDDNVIVLRPIGGQKIVLERNEIASMEAAGVSLMPSGLLGDLEDESLVDFFAYLQSTQPLNVR